MRSERGFALVAALWLLVVLGAVSLELGLRTRAARLGAANTMESARAAAAAEAGLAEVHAKLAGLLARSQSLGTADLGLRLDPWGGHAKLFRDTLRLGEARVTIVLHDPAARLDLNRAGEEELRRLFIALRLDAGAADRLAQSIADWRDPDDLSRGRGAERDDYLRQGALVLPANVPFASLAGLRHVRGMTPELLARVRPSLTLAGSGRVNLNTASRPVLLALPGMTEQSVALLLRRRRAARPVRGLEELTAELPSGPREALVAAADRLQPRITFETREVLAESVGWIAGSPVRRRVDGLFARAGGSAYFIGRHAW